MSVKSGYNNVAYGLNNPLQSLAPQPIIAQRAPLSTDSAAFGTLWINQAGTPDDVYVFTARQSWLQLAANADVATFSSLTVTGNSVLNGLVATATGNTAGDITLITNGGTTETLLLTNSQGTSASAINLTATAGGIALNGTSGVAITTTNTAFSVATGTGAINIGTDAATKAITVGNVTGTTAIAINSSATGIVLNSNALGNINIVSNKATAAAFGATNNALFGTITLTGQTIAQNASQALTITNSNITAANAVMYSVANTNVSTGGALLSVQGAIQAAGSLVITVKNVGAAGGLGATDTIIIGFEVLG